VVAAGPQHVEDDQRDRHRGEQPGARPASGHPPLQQGEIRARTGQGDNLAVQDEGPAPGGGREHAELGIGGGDVAAGAGPGRTRPSAMATQARRPSHFTSATNSAASGGSPAAGVASMGAMKPGLSPVACPGLASPRACRPRPCRGHASTVTGVLTWQYLPRAGRVHTDRGPAGPTMQSSHRPLCPAVAASDFRPSRS